MYGIIVIICGAIGWQLGALPGALVGAITGAFFARGLKQNMDPELKQKVQLSLFQTIFPLLGHIAKADGRVSEEEIQSAENMMSQMQLTPEVRQEAIRLFKAGAQAEYDLDEAMSAFMAVCGHISDIKKMLVVYLITIALADGELHPAEEKILRRVAQLLGFPEKAFEQILKMAEAQGFFHQGAPAENREKAVALAYDALGVDATISDGDLKKAYRKLMSQYHPDKLSGQGASDDMVKVATERSQEIQAAYDLLKKYRQAN